MFQISVLVDEEARFAADVEGAPAVGQQAADTISQSFCGNGFQYVFFIVHPPKSHTVAHPYLISCGFGYGIHPLYFFVGSGDEEMFQVSAVKTFQGISGAYPNVTDGILIQCVDHQVGQSFGDG